MSLSHRFAAVRAATERLTEGLSPEDLTVQSMPDASPGKWHLAHTTWFFETFLLVPAGRAPFHPGFGVLFNSYYESAGPRHARPERGLLTRPSLAEVMDYRRHVDQGMARLLAEPADAGLIELGLQHEQQHQELLLTDLLHALSRHPLAPAAYRLAEAPPAAAHEARWIGFDGGLVRIGHDGGGFAFDNESPAHTVHLAPFRLASRLVTNAEYQAFVDAGGYAEPLLWLSDGWAAAQAGGWREPLHWRADGMEMTLGGLRPRLAEAPVCHVSYYEADAFARWAGKRLPTEAEWETAARTAAGPPGAAAEDRCFRPLPAAAGPGVAQMFGDCWEWTASAYLPYPGFRPAAGAVGEYNGKFMVNQMVLRGGSCASPRGHVRASYRNFFYPHQRWQFTGIRLAEDA